MASTSPPRAGPGGAQFLDPAVLGRIGNLELLARTVVDGFLTGLHRSPYLGFSVDFAELDSIPAGEGVALSISVVGSGDVRVMYESGAGDITPSNQFWWRDPSGWRTDALNDMPCEVLGTIEREDG